MKFPIYFKNKVTGFVNLRVDLIWVISFIFLRNRQLSISFIALIRDASWWSVHQRVGRSGRQAGLSRWWNLISIFLIDRCGMIIRTRRSDFLSCWWGMNFPQVHGLSRRVLSLLILFYSLHTTEASLKTDFNELISVGFEDLSNALNIF
jgi:hypothetical protein